MDLAQVASEQIDALAATIAGADAIDPIGAGTHRSVGNACAGGARVGAPAGITRYEPEDLTVTVGAGTSFAELDAVLATRGQECPLDPRDPSATMGGIVASGLSGIRRLRHGPLRDHVLEVRFLTGDGRLVKGGGPTVKNVTGYDLPRLLVGSLGTLGVLVQLTLRCRPRPASARWFRIDDPALAAELFRAASMLWDGRAVHVLLEGTASDVEALSSALVPTPPPGLPDGGHRGRISVAPGDVVRVGRALDSVPGARWCGELGVGTVHVAADESAVIARARTIAHDLGGWLLREAGAPDLDGFGVDIPNAALMRRVKDAFDPAGKLAPGRLPL